MAQLKTRENDASVDDYLAGVEARRRDECRAVHAMMQAATGENGRMWGTSIVGFGRYHYKYASGHEGDSFLTGYAPRKQALTVYVMPGFDPYPELMKRLGKYKTGRSCLYLRKLADVDEAALAELIQAGVDTMRERYGNASLSRQS